MKTVVVGSKQLACDVFLELLEQGHEVEAVFSRDSEEGMKIWHSLGHGNLAQLAAEHGVPVYEAVGINSEKARQVLEALQLDAIFSCFWAEIFKEPILNIPRLGVFNMHTAFLPFNRGSRPIPWALIEGQEFTGITLHKMMTGVDNGPIVSQAKVEIDETDTAQSLYDKVIQAGKQLFKETLPLFESRSYVLKLQKEESATYHPRGEPYGGQINAFWPEEKKERFRRAFHFPPFRGHKEAPPAFDTKGPKVYLALGVLEGQEPVGYWSGHPNSNAGHKDLVKLLENLTSMGFKTTSFHTNAREAKEIAKSLDVVDFAPTVDAELLEHPLTASKFAPQLSETISSGSRDKNKGGQGIHISGPIKKPHFHKTFDRLVGVGFQYICRAYPISPASGTYDKAAMIGLQPFRHENGLLEIPLVYVQGPEALPTLLDLINQATELKEEYSNDVFLGLMVGPINVSLHQELIESMEKVKEALNAVEGLSLGFSSICKHYNQS